MMTTVSASYANMALLMMSAFNPNAEVVKKLRKWAIRARMSMQPHKCIT